MNLPPQAWATTPAGVLLLDTLDAAGGMTRLVGGAVRDALLGHGGGDIDLATQLQPSDVMQRLAAAGLKAIPTGLAHGTVTAVAKGLSVEITTLRRDITTDGRHAQVEFTSDWQEDASRRDFTINALYARLPSGEVSDFFGGIEDLRAHRVRFIGSPLQRIAEDHLRILRFFRFSARFARPPNERPIDAEGLAACTARANDLMALSRERIASELRGLLSVSDPLPVLTLMVAHGIWHPVLPEISAARLPVLARTIAAEAESGISPDWRRRLTALLPPDPSIVETIAARLRLSNADRARLALAAPAWDGEPLRPAAWKIGVEAVLDRLLIAGLSGPDVLELAIWQRPRLPASGRDLLARGLAPGPEVARRLAQFERGWVAAGFPQDSATVAALLDSAVAGT